MSTPSLSEPARSIDEVIDRLTAIIDSAKVAQSRLGYFAALYRKVTVQVSRGIRNGQFDDPARMERFDVIFANRYDVLASLVDDVQAELVEVWVTLRMFNRLLGSGTIA